MSLTMTLKSVRGVLRFLCLLALCGGAAAAQAQGPAEETVRVRTRVVFIDVLVKDKRTGLPVTDLGREHFEITADGRRRAVTYFSRGGERGAPLALVLVLAPMDAAARNALKAPAFVKAVGAALRGLPPGSEVAVVFSRWGGMAPPRVLTVFTCDPAAVTAAVENLPDPAGAAGSAEPAGPGSSLAEALFSLTSRRPHSRSAVVMVTDSIFQMTAPDRAALASDLLRGGATFNALVTGTDSLLLLSYPLLKPASSALGLSLYGVPRYLAEQTGGEVLRVRRPEDFGPAVERVVGGISARYSLGFTLDESERDDGRVHRLKVEATARDPRGKKRGLRVFARRGYHLPAATGVPPIPAPAAGREENR